jgi:prepilin-type N-terminal cleavage/methylation domain-containing protein
MWRNLAENSERSLEVQAPPLKPLQESTEALGFFPGTGFRDAFTLIELLVVMAIVMIIMGMALTSWFGIRRGAEMRRSVTTVQTTLMLARQQAVTKRQTVVVSFVQIGQTNAMVVKVGTNQVHSQMFLSPGVRFSTLPANVQFKPNGSAVGGDSSGMTTISLIEKVTQGTAQTKDIDLWLLTGVTRVN